MRLKFLIFFFSFQLIQSQEKDNLSNIDNILINIKLNQLKKADSILLISKFPKDIFNTLKWQINFKKYGKVDSIFLYNNTPKKFLKKNEVIKRITLGEYHANKTLNNNKAFKLFFEAKEIAKKNNDSVLTCIALKKILRFNLKKAEKINLIYNELEDLKKYAYDAYEELYHNYLSLRYKHLIYSEKKRTKFSSLDKSYTNIPDSLKILEKLKLLDKKISRLNFPFLAARVEQYIGTLETFYNKDYETSDFYYKKAILNYNKSKNYYSNSFTFGIHINLGANEYRKRNYNNAIEIISKALKKYENSIPGFKFHEKEAAFRILSNCYEKIGHYNLAHKSLKQTLIINKEVNQQSRNVAFAEISKKYKTEEKERENLILKEKRKNTQNQLIASLLFLLFGGTVALLTLNNSRKKQKIAIQEKELEQQKNITLLKEQEINAINAMVVGQEKERKRIAEDLHDNVGSVLATLKLHFENLKLNREKKQFNQEELYEKTEHLIDETYAKIRHIAHEKNAGVIANEGLLVAIKIMAEKISSANKTQIEVIDFGLDKRLENSLEIIVFRIIQELTTNIIKHAKATEASINISYYDNELSIIIEDNGKGFNPRTTNFKDGMGLHSIETRINHLQGSFTIDSVVEKGTSIIITIPT